MASATGNRASSGRTPGRHRAASRSNASAHESATATLIDEQLSQSAGSPRARASPGLATASGQRTRRSAKSLDHRVERIAAMLAEPLEGTRQGGVVPSTK